MSRDIYNAMQWSPSRVIRHQVLVPITRRMMLVPTLLYWSPHEQSDTGP